MSILHTFAKCPYCQCNSKGISIVICGNSQCKKIFCSVCGEVYLHQSSDSNKNEKQEDKKDPVAGCIHCWTVRKLIWNPTKEEPQIGKRDADGQPIELNHRRLGEVG